MLLSKPKPKKISLEDACNLSHKFAEKYEIYHITYEDLNLYLKKSRSTLYKIIPQWVKNGDYYKETYGYEAHFIHPDYKDQYYESRKEFKQQQQQEQSTDIKPPTIRKLQLTIAPTNSSISNIIYNRFQSTKYHKQNSNNSPIVLPRHDYLVGHFRFICYPNKPLNIYVNLRNLLFCTLNDFQILFNLLREQIINLCGLTIEPFSFIITQIYGFGYAFSKTRSDGYKISENKNIHLTLSEALSYLGSKYYFL